MEPTHTELCLTEVSSKLRDYHVLAAIPAYSNSTAIPGKMIKTSFSMIFPLKIYFGVEPTSINNHNWVA